MAIVIPAYKGRFLKETLDSIAVQAHKDEFVLYIGDDASPERLDKIVESYQNKVNLVYHRFSENMGGKDLVAHWERCIQLSAEPFIWLFSVWNVSWRFCRAHTISEDISFVFH